MEVLNQSKMAAALTEMAYSAVVEAAGAKYKGVIFGRVYFDNSFGSTISLAPEELTVEAVRKAVADSDALFKVEDLHPLLRKFVVKHPA